MTAAALQTLPLQPPGTSAYNPGREHDATTTKDNRPGGKRVIRLTNVSDPTLTLYPAPALGNSGAMVIVFPGGGYGILAMDLEGSEVCQWLNSIGVNAALVKYRVPQQPGAPSYEAPLVDAQHALALVRAHAKEWHSDPQRVGVSGFSAGGHLAALLSNVSSNRDMRPDFALLIYPAYLATQSNPTLLSGEVNVSPQTPPTFLVQTEDDPVHVESSLVYFSALKRFKVPVEMHIFATGGHGYGLRQTAEPVTHWPQLAEGWLRSSGIIPAH